MPALTLQEKFDQLNTVLNGELIERSAVISSQILALISRTHHFQIATPGVAKSYSVRRLVSHIGGLSRSDYYESPINKFTAVEEIQGPLDLLALQGLMNQVTGEVIVPSKYRFQIEGYAPSALIWFLDEIFKGSSAILNTLLMAINERMFRNEGLMLELPLQSMFCASNEMPEGDELKALYDRIHFRLIVKEIQEPVAFKNMLKLALDADIGAVISWEEVTQAQIEASQVEIPEDVYDAMWKLREDLKKEGIVPTDRRFKECLKIVRAAAWLDSKTVADIPHMHPLKDVLWNEMSEFPIVERMVEDLANPQEKAASELLDVVQELWSEIDKVAKDKDMDPQLKNKKGVELYGKVERAKDEFETLVKIQKKSKRKSPKAEELQSLLVRSAQTLSTQVFVVKSKTQINLEELEKKEEEEDGS